MKQGKTLSQLIRDRPLAVLDIEATGVSPRADRIVELAIVVVKPDGSTSTRIWRINPGMPIPPESTNIHGITDEDVANCPGFAQVADEILETLDNCDLAGYNLMRYDIPMLDEEFVRIGTAFDTSNRRIIDAQTIFHKREPRDLTAALAYYCGEMHLDAHGAEADVLATIRVLEGELARYPDLPRDVEALDAYCNPRDPSWVDRMGRLRWIDGEVTVNFGKKKGERIRTLIRDDPNFIKWMLRSDFPRDTLEIIQKGIQGEWPTPPRAAEESG